MANPNPTSAKAASGSSPMLVVISAPSGAGKTTLCEQTLAAIRAHAEEDAELKTALVTVFLTPPSMSILEVRLKKRGQDSPQIIAKRLSVAKQEIVQWKNFDYLIVSSSIAEDVRRLQAILDAEQMRQGRAQLPAYE